MATGLDDGMALSVGAGDVRCQKPMGRHAKSSSNLYGSLGRRSRMRMNGHRFTAIENSSNHQRR